MIANPTSGSKNWQWYRADPDKGPSVFICQCGRMLDATIQNCIIWKNQIWHAACAFGYAYQRVRVPLVRIIRDAEGRPAEIIFVRWDLRPRGLTVIQGGAKVPES